MTQNRNEKRAAREFARKHGIPYTQALRIVRTERSSEMPTTELATTKQPPPKKPRTKVDSKCGCCELGEYSTPPDDPYGPCENCGHSEEEHDLG